MKMQITKRSFIFGAVASAAASPAFAEVVGALDWKKMVETPIARQMRFKRELKRSTHIQACPRIKVMDCPVPLPPEFFSKNLIENQLIESCCRHPENHEIEAFYSSLDWKEKRRPDGYYEPYGGVPDIYINHCTCGRKHIRFMVGIGDYRPFWGEIHAGALPI